MATNTFSQRYGYQVEPLTYAKPEDLPAEVRELTGRMILEHFDQLTNGETRFIKSVVAVLQPSKDLYRWSHTVPEPDVTRETDQTGWSYEVVDNTDRVIHLIQPLMNCDWWLFYDIVEAVYAEWERTGSRRGHHFTLEFNRILASFRIPWQLQSGWITPVADAELEGELAYAAQQAAHTKEEALASNPHAMIKVALDALYSRNPGISRATACRYAWEALHTAIAQASDKKLKTEAAFNYIKQKYPVIWDTMQQWKSPANDGPHPSRPSDITDDEIRFIVMFCVISVRFLSEAP